MDINIVSIARTILETVTASFPSVCTTAVANEKETLIASSVLEQLYNSVSDYQFEDEDVLEIDSNSEHSSYSQDILVDEAGIEVTPETSDGCTLDKKIEILKLIADHPKWSLKSIQKRGGKEFKYWNYKQRWESHISRGGTRFDKYRFIDKYVFEKFEEARKEFRSVHDRNLQIWGLQASQTFHDPEFRFLAGVHWLQNFKQKHCITSRKVTKLVSKRQVNSMEALLQSAQAFQAQFKEIAANFLPSAVLNTDQAGFFYEIASTRTLSHRGEKDTYGIAKSPRNLVTHSYTAQYLISMEEVVGDVFICFQERSGRLGPKIQENLFPASNVCVTCSVSGKLTSSLYEYYLDNVLCKSVSDDFLFLVDSWSPHTNSEIYATRFGVNGSPNCTLQIIPPNTTSLCQPLDTTFHRQLKIFVKRIYEEASLNYNTDVNPTDEVTTRNNILRTHSLVQNQLKSEAFKPMIKYCWYSAGLTNEKVQFSNVKEICFSYSPSELICELCGEKNTFIKCAYCRKCLCFVCFYYNYHFHYN